MVSELSTWEQGERPETASSLCAEETNTSQLGSLDRQLPAGCRIRISSPVAWCGSLREDYRLVSPAIGKGKQEGKEKQKGRGNNKKK